MEWREELPKGCPPLDARVTTDEHVYRIVSPIGPAEADFHSQRKLQPGGTFSLPECIVRGISVLDNRQDAEKRLRLPKFKGYCICRVTLCKNSGRIKKTLSASHYTWWPLAKLDILSRCNKGAP